MSSLTFHAVISKTAYRNCSQPQWLTLNAQQGSFFSLFLATNSSTIENNFYCDDRNYRKRTRRKLSTSELFIHQFYDPLDGLQYLSTSSYKPKIWKFYDNDFDKAPQTELRHLCHAQASRKQTAVFSTSVYVDHSSDINRRLQEHKEQYVDKFGKDQFLLDNGQKLQT